MQDWELLYLNGCWPQHGCCGRNITQHVAVVREIWCTIGYVATPHFARKILAALTAAHWIGVTPIVDLFYRVSSLGG